MKEEAAAEGFARARRYRVKSPQKGGELTALLKAWLMLPQRSVRLLSATFNDVRVRSKPSAGQAEEVDRAGCAREEVGGGDDRRYPCRVRDALSVRSIR